jgi:hypothetical protein
MKVSQAKKIERIWKGVGWHWESVGTGYAFRNSRVSLFIGNCEGKSAALNLDTVQAKTLDDCLSLPIDGAHHWSMKNMVTGVSIDAGDHIFEALERSLKIVDDNADRNYGTVAKVYYDGKAVKVVATDSFMLYEHSEEFSEGTDFSFCIGEREIKTVLAFFGKDTPQWSKAEYDDCVILSCGNKIAHIRTSAIKYPNYSSVMPDLIKYKPIDWTLDFPKVKGAIAAIVDQSEAIYIGKGYVNLGKGYMSKRNISPVVLNPRYLDFVNDCPKDVIAWQSRENPENEVMEFNCYKREPVTYGNVREKIIIVPITYKPEEIERMRA